MCTDNAAATQPNAVAVVTKISDSTRRLLSVRSGILALMTDDTWTTRDLPVLKAAVELYDQTGRTPRATEIERECGFDHDTVQRALRALNREPFFENGLEAHGGEVIFVGEPTGDALRVAGQWPSPETQLGACLLIWEFLRGRG